MDIPKMVDKLSEKVYELAQRLGLGNMPSEEETKSYYEMAYGLLISRGLKNGYRDWSIGKERVQNYIEFHLNKPCNGFTLSAVIKDIAFNKSYEESDLAQLKNFKNSGNYQYDSGIARTIADAKLQDLQALATVFQNETVKKYYIVSCGLLSSVRGVTSKGIKKYLESKLGGACDSEALDKVLTVFVQHATSSYSHNEEKLYWFTKNAKDLYLNKHVFGGNMEELAKPYKCAPEEAYAICYPEAAKNIKEDYQKILHVLETQGKNDFDDHIGGVVRKYKDIIGQDNIKEYIRIITKGLYFEGNKTVATNVIKSVDSALYEEMMDTVSNSLDVCQYTAERQALAIALRALNFEKYTGNQEAYTSVTKEDYCKFVSNNAYFQENFEKEIAKKPLDTSMDQLVESQVKSAESFNWYSKFSTDLCFLPNMKTDPYYADALCNAFWKYIVNKRQEEILTDPDAVFELLLNYLSPSDNDAKILQKKKEEMKIREQCDSCMFKDRCKRPDKVLNCPSYLPK